MTRIVAGLLDGHRAADLVVEHLVQECGIPRGRIQIHAADAASGEESRSTQDDDQGASLAELGLPEEAVRRYGEGMRRGGVLLAAWVEKDQLDQALATYREYSATGSGAWEARLPDAAGEPEQRVRLRAYQLWEREGCPEGRDLEFWHQACADEGTPDGGRSSRA